MTDNLLLIPQVFFNFPLSYLTVPRISSSRDFVPTLYIVTTFSSPPDFPDRYTLVSFRSTSMDLRISGYLFLWPRLFYVQASSSRLRVGPRDTTPGQRATAASYIEGRRCTGCGQSVTFYDHPWGSQDRQQPLQTSANHRRRLHHGTFPSVQGSQRKHVAAVAVLDGPFADCRLRLLKPSSFQKTGLFSRASHSLQFSEPQKCPPLSVIRAQL